MPLIKSIPPTQQQMSDRDLYLFNLLSEEQKVFIKKKFLSKNFYQSTTTYLYCPTFVSLESVEIKQELQKLVVIGIATFDKNSGYTIYNKYIN